MSLFGRQAARKPRREEAEKPFWISFSDLMTALMVLFLVAMTVALLAITNEISETEKQKAERDKDIQQLLQRLQTLARDFPGVEVRGPTIDFGERARFETNSHRLDDAESRLLRAFVPKVLQLARDPLGQQWLKRISVEGFADPRGSYLHNLNLSLQRSERVLCILLASPDGAPDALSEADRRLVREIFLVSGASFNAPKSSAEASRRIELKLEFLERGQQRETPKPVAEEETRCPLDAR